MNIALTSRQLGCSPEFILARKSVLGFDEEDLESKISALNFSKRSIHVFL